MRGLWLVLWLVGGMVLLYRPLAAQVPGQGDAAFQDALVQWLDGVEAAALPALAGQAKAGNPAARLLLGMIDKTGYLQGPWLATRPKAVRIGLLRAPGGLSGQSWLRDVKQVPLATQYLAVLDSAAGIDAALALVDLGEAGAARRALIALEARQVTGFAAFADDPRFPAEMRYLIWREWQKSGHPNPELANWPAGDGQRAIVTGPLPIDDLVGWLNESPLAASLRRLCQRQCPESRNACLFAGYRAIGGYRRLAALASPAQALVSEPDFAASAQGQASLLRQALGYAFLTAERRRQIRRQDACFADILTKEGQRF